MSDSDFVSRLLQSARGLEDKSHKLALLHDKIFLHGFSSPFSPEYTLRMAPDFLNYKTELGAMNDIFSSSMKGIMKYRDRTLSLSNQWLKDGHGFAKDNLDFAYQNLLQGGCGKEKAVHLITSMLKEVQVNRQSATVSTWFDTELPEGIKKVGFPDIALPLETAKGGLSGAMAETIEASIKNIRGQLLELCKQPKVEMLFEKGIKTGKGLSL